MPESRFESLDALAAAFPLGMIRYRAGDREPLARVIGYVYSLPLEPGGPKEPALVIYGEHGPGNVYPWEVTIGPIAAPTRTTGKPGC